MMRTRLLVATALLAVTAPVSAQSLFGTRGLGVPVPALDARAAALGGIGLGLIGFNTVMANPAEIAGVTRRGVVAALQPVTATSTVDGEKDGTSGTRFPLMRMMYPISPRLIASVGYGSYLEQSWAILTESQQVVGDRVIETTDVLRSSGGIAQLQLGAAYSFSQALSVGAAAGLLTGNVIRQATRVYADTSISLRGFQERLRWEYFAPIATVGFRLDLAGVARLSGSILAGGDLKATGKEGGAEDRDYGAPLELSAGASARVSSLLMANAGAVWARLPEAGDGAVTRETLRVGGGIEYQGVRSGSRTYPVRLGARWTQLPYHLDGEEAPTETGIAFGFGFRLGEPTDPAAVTDITIERASRNGLGGGSVSDGIAERLWRFTFSLSLFGR